MRSLTSVVARGSSSNRLVTRSGRSVAVDHNAAAIERFSERGGEGYVLGFDSFAQGEEGHFDVVTSFHTLEHVADPVGIARSRGAMFALRRKGVHLGSQP